VRLLILFIFFLPTTVYAHGTIIITNVEHDEGYIDLKIYNNKENFEFSGIFLLSINGDR